MKRVSMYYLNDYPLEIPSLRVEKKRGGDRTIWCTKTTLPAMEFTRDRLKKVWKRD